MKLDDNYQLIADDFNFILQRRYTTVAGCRAAVQAISALMVGQLEVSPLQSYFNGSF